MIFYKVMIKNELEEKKDEKTNELYFLFNTLEEAIEFSKIAVKSSYNFVTITQNYE